VDVAEKIMAIKTEIIEEVKEENTKRIEKKREELIKKYNRFQNKLESKKENILKSYKNKAEQKREQIISRAILEKKSDRRKKLNECMNNFIQELKKELENFTAENDYYLFIYNSLKEAVLELPDNEFIVFIRAKDENLKSDLENRLQKEMNNYYFEIKLTDKIKSGGFIIKTKNKQQLLENTFAALIDSSREEIAIELKKNILAQK